ncbi:MAG: hypothetical protein AB1Z98_01330 [Nannocystaceae bacterium]
MRASLLQAKAQFNELELEASLATLDAAIARAQGLGMGADPAIAPLHVLRGGIIYSIDGDRSRTVAAFQEAVRADYNVALPIELRSEELQILLDEAQASVARPATGPIAHTAPEVAAGQDISLDALSSVPVEEGATMVVYWRKRGSEDAFNAVYMDLFGNLGTVAIPAAEHGDAGIEYFFYVYNAQQQQLANLGDKDKPLVLELGEGAVEGGGAVDGGREGGGNREGRRGGRSSSGTHVWPRVFIGLGVGTGFGIARGTAELTYKQFIPGASNGYGVAQQACAIERWNAGEREVAGNQNEFAQNLAMLDDSFLPSVGREALAAAYNPADCAQRHPVTTGFASAPFHLAPEIGIRVLDRDLGTERSLALVVSAFGRLQVVTGSKVITEDPTKSTQTSFVQEVTSVSPPGFQRKPPFTWAAGIKLKALIAKKGSKLQGMIGAFGGYGNARLRINMGFSNDRNGNSVPDREETALSGPVNENNEVPMDQCTPVWPYNNGCLGTEPGIRDQNDALTLANNTPANELRIDTVRMGPGFAGVLFGFHYQIHKNFAVYGEANVGGWFPSIGSLLIDVNLGPVITF